MNYLIPPLDTVLLIVMSLYPVGFCANVTATIKAARNFRESQSLAGSLIGFVAGYAVILAVAALIRPEQVLAFKAPPYLAIFLLAPVVGVACIASEYLMGILLLFWRTRKLVTRVSVHSSYSMFSRITSGDVLCILALVIGEELVLRQLLYNLFVVDCAMALSIAIPLCAIAFAANHLSFGIASVVSKLPSGFFYILLFFLADMSVGVVILAHATQNLTLLALSRRAGRPE